MGVMSPGYKMRLSSAHNVWIYLADLSISMVIRRENDEVWAKNAFYRLHHTPIQSNQV